MTPRRLSAALDRTLRRLLNKEYRDGYLQTHVRSGIAYQIRSLREKTGLSQAQFADATGKKQSTISRLEDTDYGRVSVQTLLDIASALNVALLVRFVDFPQFLKTTEDMSPQALAPDDVFESKAKDVAEQHVLLSRLFSISSASQAQESDVQDEDTRSGWFFSSKKEDVETHPMTRLWDTGTTQETTAGPRPN
jgi:transcriptional regulator with XRE-family HTH domain